MSLTLGRRGLCVLLLSMTASCPPLDDGYPDVSVRVSDYGHSISAVLQATVPQGTWQLRVEGDQQTETGNIKALGLGSISRDLQVTCPRGKCSFELELSASPLVNSSDQVGLFVYYVFEPEDTGDGCEKRNPNYVNEVDRERFFKLRFRDVRVVHCEEAEASDDAAWDGPSVVLSPAAHEVIDCDGYPKDDPDDWEPPDDDDPERGDAGLDGRTDGSVDAGSDGSVDAGSDGSVDAGDAGD